MQLALSNYVHLPDDIIHVYLANNVHFSIYYKTLYVIIVSGVFEGNRLMERKAIGKVLLARKGKLQSFEYAVTWRDPSNAFRGSDLRNSGISTALTRRVVLVYVIQQILMLYSNYYLAREGAV